MSTLTIEEVSISSQAPGAGGVSRLLDVKLYEGAVSILDYRAADATSDTAAFGLAVATGKPVYFPAGQGSGEDGEYLITTTSVVSGNTEKVGFLTAGTTIFGDGMGKTVIRPAAADQTIFRSLSSGPTTTIDNITIRDLTLFGYSETAFFSEHDHLAAFSGVRNPLIERVEFKEFQGDGIYFGTGETAGNGRHNYNLKIIDCLFDGGTNRHNRNGITIVDGDKVTITCNSFRSCTTSNMPGAVDFEPDATDTTAILRDIEVSNNLFSAIGGTPGVISFPIPSAVAALPRNIRISGNEFRNYAGTGAEICINVAEDALARTDDDMAVVIENNLGVGGKIPYDLRAIKGIVFHSNVWDTYTTNAVLGLGATQKLIDCAIWGDRFHECGSETDGRGIRIGTCDGLDLIDVLLYKCGAASSLGFPIQFAQGVTSDRVTIRGLRVVANTNQTTAIDREENSHTFGSGNSGSNNRLIDSDLGGLASEFVATGKGQLLTGSATWNPGSLTTGTGETSSAITVTGASFGDIVQVAAPYDLQGIACSGYVSASNSVKIRIQNGTGGTLDLASGTWKVLVTKALA